MSSLLRIENLSVEYPTRRAVFRALDDVSLTVEAGEIHGLVGESGAGKSTVGAAAMGLIERPGRISGGDVFLSGERISGRDEDAMRALRGRRISMIFQDPLTSLNPLFTVRDQLTETILAHLDVSTEEADQRALDLLDRVGIPDPSARLEQYPHQFSGGMRQRIVIALALCSEPAVVIADEPTTALDVSIQAQVLGLVRELVRERRLGVILITHDMGVIAETADRVSVMHRGAVVETGPTETVLRRPTHEYTQALIAAVPPSHRRLDRFPIVAAETKAKDFDIDSLAATWPAPASAASAELVRVRGLTKRFKKRTSIVRAGGGDFIAVDKVDFDIGDGEIFGLVGESGSGKSTVARMIAGIVRADGGSIHFDGRDVGATARGAPLDYRRQIQMIFQDPFSSLNPRMRVDQIVAEPIRHFGLLRGRALRMRVAELLDLVGLGSDAGERRPHQFSGGQRQRISIARALATQPRFLICDEPTSALDVSIQAQILNILKDLRQRLNLTILFISHDLPVVRQMCDRVAVMRRGAIVETAETEKLFDQPSHAYTRELLTLMPRFDAAEPRR